jgi:hypothetical protein
MNVLKLPVTLYRHAELLCGLVVAACGAVLMSVAVNPDLAAIAPDSMLTQTVYAEFALMACVIAGSALLHARGGSQVSRTGLWLTTALWWVGTALFFNLSPIFGLMGTVASLACIASIGATHREAEPVPAIVTLDGSDRFGPLSLYGRSR